MAADMASCPPGRLGSRAGAAQRNGTEPGRAGSVADAGVGSGACRGRSDSACPRGLICGSRCLWQMSVADVGGDRRGWLTGKPLAAKLCRRVVDLVGEGRTHRGAAAQSRVSVVFANDMVLLKRATGCPGAGQQGNGGGHGKLAGVADRIRRRIREKREPILDGPVVEPGEEHGVEAHRTPVWRHLRGLGPTPGKDLRAIRQKRPGVAPARPAGSGRRQPFMFNMPIRLAFIDEPKVRASRPCTAATW